MGKVILTVGYFGKIDDSKDTEILKLLRREFFTSIVLEEHNLRVLRFNYNSFRSAQIARKKLKAHDRELGVSILQSNQRNI